MYYIYEIWDLDSNQPIYVGYGKGQPNDKYKRYMSHLKEAHAFKNGKIRDKSKLNMYKINVLLNTTEVEYRFPFTGLTYDQVCKKERELISKYGRRITNTGPLTNIDPGGRGGMVRTDETCQKISDSLKGRPSPHKGKVLGNYSEDRVARMAAGLHRALSGPNGDLIRQNISRAQSGKTLSEDHKNKISESLKGRPSPQKGKEPWNKGLTAKTDERIKKYTEKSAASLKGRQAWNKGKSMSSKGKSYEEIYGPETAKRMKEARSKSAWVTKDRVNKKVKLEEISQYLNDGWSRSRYMPKRTK